MTSSNCSHSRATPGVEGWWCPQCSKLISDSAYQSVAVGRSAQKSDDFVPPSDSKDGAWHRVYPYKSHGTQYFRYAWGVGHQVLGSRHIPGGNIRNPIAQNRAAQVRAAIESGLAPTEIEKIIDRWTW